MVEAEYTEQRQLAENHAEMLKIQEKLTESQARAEIYSNHGAKSLDGRSQLPYKIDLA